MNIIDVFFPNYSITLLVIIIVLIVYYSTCTFNFWKNRGVPYISPMPFFGNTFFFTFGKENISTFVFKVYNSFPDRPFSGCYMLRDPVLILRDPELISNLLIRDFSHFHNRVVSFINVNKKLNPLSGNLFTLEGNRWKCLRQKLSPVFTSGKLKTMFGQMKECGMELTNSLETNIKQSTVVELREVMAKYATDVIGTCAFGLDCQSLKDPNSEFRTVSREVFQPRRLDVVKAIIQAIHPSLVNVLRLKDRSDRVVNFYIRIVEETLEYRKKHNIERNDFLKMLMDLRNNSSNIENPANMMELSPDDLFDDIDVVANAFSFFVAGFENISLVSGYILYELSLNQDVQQKLYNEIQDVKKKYAGEITFDSLKELTYLDMVIAETLRKYPAAPVLFRKCTKSYTIPGTNVTLPEGTKVLVPTLALQHDEEYYPDPKKFDPERFNAQNKAARKSGTYLPFGDGPRFCIGKLFAQMEIKTALSEIISNFQLSPCYKTEIPLQFLNGSPFLMAKNGIWVNIQKRKC